MKKILALICTLVLALSLVGTLALAEEDNNLLIGVDVRSLDNEYFVFVVDGINAFADRLRAERPDLNVEVQVLLSEYSNEQELSNIKTLIAKGGKNTIIYCDPNETTMCAAIAEVCEEAGVYWGTCWSLDEDVYPTDYDHYVYFQTPGIVESMEKLCLQLFESFETPNEGKILAVQGNMATTAGNLRFNGLEAALEKTPGVELVAAQDCNFEVAATQACVTTWLSMYDFDDIDAIWVDNDENAIAALEVLTSNGYDGKVVVTGFDGTSAACTAIQEGKMFATVCSNAQKQGGYGTSYLYHVWNGDVDLSTVPAEQRMFYTVTEVLNPNNVGEYITGYIKGDALADVDWMDYQQLILSGYPVD